MRMLLLCGILAAGSGCATYIHPERAAVAVNQRGPVDGFMFFCDLLFTGGLGLIIDYAHGTIYVPKLGYAGPGAEKR